MNFNISKMVYSDWQDTINNSKRTTQHYVYMPSELKVIACGTCTLWKIRVMGLQGNVFKVPYT